MTIYQVFALLPGRKLVAGAILAEDRVDAISRAIERIKSTYGSGSKVTGIYPLIDIGDIKRIHHSGLHQLLTEFDQLRFVTWHLAYITREMSRMVAELTEVIRSQCGEAGDAA